MTDTVERMAVPETATDVSGRDRMAFNVAASWAGHLVFVVAGLLMPRLIDRHLGEAALGVWDFAWSMMAYMGMVQLGIGASVNPYIARYRASGQPGRANGAVSSVFCLLLAAAGLVVILTLVIGHYAPALLHARLGSYVHEARWVLYLLGACLAMQIGLTVFGGVITGCHRWDIHNAIQAGFYGAEVAAMAIALHLGGDLVTLAAIMLAGTATAETVRVFLAYRVHPGLSVHPRHARWSVARTMIGFGGKTFLDSLSRLLFYQTTSILLLSYLGPAALAFYSRPANLVRHCQTLIGKFAFVLTPTASSLHAAGRVRDLRRFLTDTTRLGACLSLPMVLLLAILGGPILRLWMGAGYAYGGVLAILAVGHLVPMAQQPLWNILVGLNWHGRAALANVLAAIAAVVAAGAALGPLRGGLAGAALAVVVPLTIANGLYMPWYACRQLKMPLRSYLFRSWGAALLMNVPYALCLLACRRLFADSPAVALSAGMGSGGLVLAALYWKFVLPPGLQARFQRRLRIRRRDLVTP